VSRPCPSGKVEHANLRAAHGSAHAFAIQLNAEGKLAPSLYVYRCPDCRRWHVTKRASWDGVPNHLAWEAAPEELQRWAMPESVRQSPV